MRRLLVRFGVVGFTFFLVKGLVWLVLGAVAFQGAREVL